MVNILCMKWGDKFPSAYVNRLYAMVQRNLTLPHRFLCFTDNAAGIRAEVETLPLPPLPLPPGAPERGWRKLCMLQENLGGGSGNLSGQALFLDLDVVLVANIDALFKVPGHFIIAKDGKNARRREGNSSVFRFDIGRYAAVLENFKQNAAQIKKEVRHEQAYLTREINRLGELQFWPDGWAVSYKYHCCPSWFGSWFAAPSIPRGAKILIFHGLPNPPDAIKGNSGKWYRRIRPAPWLRDYWRE